MGQYLLYFAIVILFWAPTISMGQETEDEQKDAALGELESTRLAQQQIAAIPAIDPQDFPRELKVLRDSIERFFGHKKRVCNGEFSTVILSPIDVRESGISRDDMIYRKLNVQERKMCFREMKEMQVQYINNVFQARKSYLEYLHSQRIEELDRLRAEAVESLERGLSGD